MLKRKANKTSKVTYTQKKRANLYTEDQISQMNKTYRPWKDTVVARLVRELATQKDVILDFGAGRDAIQARAISDMGYNIVAYDIGDNFNPEYHDADALRKMYTIVYASNVLNVQHNFEQIYSLISLLSSLLSRGGMLIVNYPSKPRYSDLSISDIHFLLSERFRIVNRGSNTTSPTWVCVK